MRMWGWWDNVAKSTSISEKETLSRWLNISFVRLLSLDLIYFSTKNLIEVNLQFNKNYKLLPIFYNVIYNYR